MIARIWKLPAAGTQGAPPVTNFDQLRSCVLVKSTPKPAAWGGIPPCFITRKKSPELMVSGIEKLKSAQPNPVGVTSTLSMMVPGVPPAPSALQASILNLVSGSAFDG